MTVRVATDESYAKTNVVGVVKLSSTPASATNPIAVGDNDPRWGNYFWSGATITGLTNASNLGALSSGILKQSVAGGIATPLIANLNDTTYGCTLITTGPTSVTLPTTGTLATLTDLDNKPFYAGVSTKPSYTDHGDGSVTIGTGICNLYTNGTGIPPVRQYTISGDTYTLTDNSINYIYYKYNSGSPVIAITTNRNDVVSTCFTDATPIFSIYRMGTTLMQLDWDEAGDASPEKMLLKDINLRRFARYDGLAISDAGSQQFAVTSGTVYYGLKPTSIDAFTQATDTTYLYSLSGSTWTGTSVSVFNNTQYQNGSSGLATLTSNRYAVNWVYRSICDKKICFVILGTGDYTLAQAEAAQVPANIPTIISTVGMLVGKIIVQKGDTAATAVYSAFDVQYSTSPGALDHNSLAGLQGGGASEYYHLTSSIYTLVNQYASATLSGLLSSTDWSTFNSKQTHSNNLDSLSALSWISGAPFVKMTGASTFALDTNTYLTSAIWASPITVSDATIATSTSAGGALNTVGTISTQVSTTETAAATYYPGHFVGITHDPATASSSAVFAGHWQIATLPTTASDVSNLRAGSFRATHAGTGGITASLNCAFFDSVVAATASGTIASIYGNYLRANLLGAVTITSAYVLRNDLVVNNSSLTVTTARVWGGAVTLTAGSVGTLVGLDVPALVCSSLTAVSTAVYGIRTTTINGASGTIAPNAAAIKTGNVSGATINKQLDLGTAISTFADTTDCTGANTGSIQTLGGIYGAKVGWFAGGGHFGGATDYSNFESDGTLVFNGAATVWKDIQYSISSGKVGAANVPTWSTFISPMSEYTFAVNDTIDLGSQEIIHEYKEGTDLTPHIHWVLNGAAGGTARKIQWQIDYTWCVPGSSTWTTSSKTVEITTAASAADKTHYLSNFPVISGTGVTIGTQLKIKLTRIAKSAGGSDPTGNPFVLQVGVHVECDTTGSRTISSK